MELFSYIPVCFLNFILIIPFLPLNYAQFTFQYQWCSNSTYVPNSKYQSNLNQLMKSLSSDSRITSGFYNSSTGQVPDRVEATVLCRGDVPEGTCRACVQGAAAALPLVCRDNKEGFGYSSNAYCIIFYSNKSIFNNVLVKPSWTITNNEDASYIPGLSADDMPKLNQTVYALMGKLQKEAAKGDSKLKYAVGQANINGKRSLYGLVQCNPDLSGLDCFDCVQGLLAIFPKYVTLSDFLAAGERSISPSCNIQYELFKFYGNVSEIALPPAPPPESRKPPQLNGTTIPIEVIKTKKFHKTRVIAIAISGSIALLIVIASACVLLRRRKQEKSSPKFNKEEIETLQSLQYSFGAIKAATKDFTNDNKLGQGGFGTVYKGTLSDGQEIAVKRLSVDSGQGDAQFKNEILILAKLQHRNLVKLLGFCSEGEEMILIYEFVSNGSLDKYLHDEVLYASMDWETRSKIIHGTAKGLHYLHEDSRLRIIHRDLKAGNVLLDAEFNPKIADFGMARLFNIDQTQAEASKIVGTYGYMPPEYVLHGRVSTKLDVYSFGVLVLEIVSGQTIGSFQIGEEPGNLLSFAWKNWLEGTAWNLVDPALSTEFSAEIIRCIHIGLLCVQHNLADRPNMSSVALMLTSNAPSLQAPSQPAFLTRSDTSNAKKQTSTKTDECSINMDSVTEPYAR